MPVEPVSAPDRDPRLQNIIKAYLAAVAAGETPDRQEWLKRYPDLAVELTRFFEQFDQETHTGPPKVVTPEPGETASYIAPRVNVSPAAPLSTFGDYELLEEIGHGSVGVVYRARQRSRGRMCALKRIRSELLATPADVRRFQHQAEQVAALDHPNLVPILEVGEQAGEHFYTMRLLEGRSLERRLQPRPGKAQQQQAAQWIALLARALHYAHQRGVLHGNLKPANILLDEKGQPHLTDFGLLKRSDNTPSLSWRETRPLGAASAEASGYLAPEQTTGQRAPTIASDVYGLGAILYALLTGRPPFRGASTFETLLHVRERTPEAPRSLNPEVDRNLEAICLKCLEKEPGRRYLSAAALAEDLDNWVQGRRITLGASSGRSSVLSGSRRSILAVAAACVLLLLSGSVVAWFLQAEAASLLEEKDALAEKQTRLAEQERKKREAAEKEAEKQILVANEARKQRDDEAKLKKDAQDAQEAAEQERDGANRKAREAEDKSREAAAAKLKAEQRFKQLERDTYSMRVGLARHELFTDHRDGAAKLLDLCPATQRGWEWRYLKRLCHRELLTLSGHEEAVTCVAYSPDGKYLVSAGAEDPLLLWDATSGKLLKKIPAGSGGILSLAFFPDSKRVFLGGMGGQASVWDLSSGKQMPTVLGHAGPVTSVAVSPDGKWLASAGSEAGKGKTPSETGEVTLWDAETGNKLHTLPTQGRVWGMAFSPDGQQLAAVGEGKNVEIWDPKSGKLRTELPAPAAPMSSVAFSPDGKLLAAAGGSLLKPSANVAALLAGGALRVWDTATAKELYTQHRCGEQGGISSVAFSPTGQYLAFAGAVPKVTVAWAATGQELFVLRGHRDGVSSVAFSPDGSRLASGDLARTVKVWELTAEPDGLLLAGHFGPVTDLAFSANSKLLASGSTDGLVKFWDPATGQEFGTGRQFQPVTRLALSPTGDKLASGTPDGWIHLWKAGPAHYLGGWKAHDAAVIALAFTSDGNGLASSGADKTVKIWNLQNGKLLRSFPFPTPVVDLFYTAEGTQLALAYSDRIELVDVSTGEKVSTFESKAGPVRSIALSPDGELIAAARASGALEMWHVPSGKKKLDLLKDNNRFRWAVAFSSDKKSDTKRLAALASSGALRFWDVSSGNEVLSLSAPKVPFPRLAFSPDGRWLACSSADNKIKLWDGQPFDPEKQAERLQQADRAVVSWHWRESRNAERAKDWPAAFFHLDRLLKVAPEPEQWLVRYERGRLHSVLHQWEQSIAELTKVIDITQKDAMTWHLRGQVYAEMGRWEKSASDYAKLVTSFKGIPIQWWSEHALVRLQLGDRDGYRKACNTMLALVNQSKNMSDAVTTVWTCCLAPDAVDDYDAVLFWAQKAAERGSDYVSARALGAALYRAGLQSAAVEQLAATATLRKQPSPTVWLLLALAEQQRGERKQAEGWLEKAGTWITQARQRPAGTAENLAWDQINWTERVALQLLYCEAEASIRGK
jgi:WD40 repeat protein